jgi:hypothetical protein
MANPLIIPVAGPYTALYTPPNANSYSPYYNVDSGGAIPAQALGLMNDNGYEISCNMKGEMVNRTDAYAMTLLEVIYQGQDWSCQLTGKEWTTALMLLLQPFGALPTVVASAATVTWGILAPRLSGSISASPGAGTSLAGGIGSKGSLAAGTLVLNSILGGVPTAPTSLTAPLTIMTPESRANFQFTSKVRDLPLQLSFLPYKFTGEDGNYYAIPFLVT